MSSSLQEKRINESGPYVYRVTYTGENDGNTHKWEYLGLVGHVDPRRVDEDLDADALTDDEIEQLREEDQLSQFREHDRAEFASLAAARAARDELVDRFGETVLAETDDRRLATVTIAEDASPIAQTVAQDQAADDREAAATVGQAELTRSEIDAIDWSKDGQNIPHAMAAKAALADEGIDDWQSLYSGDVESDGWAEIAEANRESIQGDRMDNETDNVDMTREQADSQLERRAIDAAADGIDEAADQLREEFGYTDQQIEALQ